jgi:hypothetical protein
MGLPCRAWSLAIWTNPTTIIGGTRVQQNVSAEVEANGGIRWRERQSWL